LPLNGAWFAVPEKIAVDAVEEDEIRRERVRILLDRYVVIFPELLRREMEGFRWIDLFPTLRLMELAGEVIGGLFVEGVGGPQFALPGALKALSCPFDDPYWINAADPVSMCGLHGSPARLPERRKSTYLVFSGGKAVFVILREGKEIAGDISTAPPKAMDALSNLYSHLLCRDFSPQRKIRIEKVAGREAVSIGGLREHLEKSFEVHADFKALQIFRKHR